MANAIKDIAVVTGGASGIGLGTVELLAERDIHVIAVDRDEYKLAKLENHERIHPLSGNVSSNDTWQEVIALAKTDLGQAPNMYVANAATVIVGTTLELSDDDWSTILETNLMGTVRGARALLPGMIAAGKGAIAQFSKALAVDHARQNIRVNCVCPGVTDTPLFRYHLSKSDEPEAVLAARTDRNPLGRLLTPADIARTVAFLLSDDAAGITGALIPVDAGLSTSFEFRTGAEWGDML